LEDAKYSPMLIDHEMIEWVRFLADKEEKNGF
jgi:hypothetical protein